MKSIFLSGLISLLPFYGAQAMPAPAVTIHNFELMKCTSQKNGTIWASFGHRYTSDSDQVTYFPTEIVVFAQDQSSDRLQFPNINDGLKIPVTVRSGFVKMEFSTHKENVESKHVLTIVQADMHSDNAYAGNWSVIENGKETADQTFCSLD